MRRNPPSAIREEPVPSSRFSVLSESKTPMLEEFRGSPKDGCG